MRAVIIGQVRLGNHIKRLGNHTKELTYRHTAKIQNIAGILRENCRL